MTYYMYRCIYIYIYMYIYIYICTCMYRCVCIYVMNSGTTADETRVSGMTAGESLMRNVLAMKLLRYIAE
jgi:hypothetical protein